LSGFDFNLAELTNNKPFDLDFKGAISCSVGKEFQLKKGRFSGSVNAEFDHNLKSSALLFKLSVQDLDAQNDGVKLPVDAFDVVVDIAMAEDTLKINSMRLVDGRSNSDSQVELKGEVGLDEKVDLSVSVNNVDANLLNLAIPFLASNSNWQRWQTALKEASDGKLSGFGDTQINYEAKIVKNGAAPAEIEGALSINRLPLVRQGGKSQLVEFNTQVKHQFIIDDTKELITVETLVVQVDEDKRSLLKLILDAPVVIDPKLKKATLENNQKITFSIDKFDLAFLKPFIKAKKREGLKSGTLSLSSYLLSKNDGEQLHLNLESLSISDLAVENGDETFANIEISAASSLVIESFKQATLANLVFAIKKDNEACLDGSVKGQLALETLNAQVSVEEIFIRPGLDQFIPKDLYKELGLENLNLTGKDINLNYTDGALVVTGAVESHNIKLGGKTFVKTKLSQKTAFELTLNKDKKVEIKTVGLSVSSPSFPVIDVNIHGNLSLPEVGGVLQSKLVVSLPSTVNADALLALLKPVEDGEKEVVKESTPKTPPQKLSTKPVGKTEEKLHLNVAVDVDVKRVIAKGQSVEDLHAELLLDGEKLFLKNTSLAIDDALLNITAELDNGPLKSLVMNVKGSGFMKMTAVNNILNSGTKKQVLGKVEILNIDASSKGKDNDELLENFKAESVVNLADLEIKNYAEVPSFVAKPLDVVLGVDPNHIKFYEGKVDVKVENKTLSVNECRFQGKAFMVNPTGSLQLTDKDYLVNLNAGAGFGGGKVLQFLSSSLGQMLQKKSNSKELDSFKQNFSYSDASKLFELTNSFIYSKAIPIKSEEATNNLSADFLSGILTHAGQLANLKEGEISRLQKLAKGEANLLEEGLNIGLDILKKKQRKKDGEDSDGAEEKEKSDDLVDTLFNIFDKKKRKKETKPKDQPKKEEAPKKEDKPINRKDDLIKGLENLFK
jgi:hypothetical protein